MKTIYLSMFCFSCYPMSNDEIINLRNINALRSRAQSRDAEEEKLLQITLCFNPPSINNGVGAQIQNKVRNKLRSIRDSDDAEQSEQIEKLEKLKPYSLCKARRRILRDKTLHDYINKLVGDAIEENAVEKDRLIEYLEKKSRRKEKHKRVAIGVAVGSTLLTIATALLIHFVEGAGS